MLTEVDVPSSANINREYVKYGLIVILGGVFVKVLFSQGILGSNTPAPPAASIAAATPKLTAPNQPVSRSSQPTASSRAIAVWPNFELANVLGHNPFQSAIAQMPKETSAAVEEKAERIAIVSESWPVDTFFESNQGAVAVARGKTLRLGQVVEEKWRVTALNAESARLDPL